MMYFYPGNKIMSLLSDVLLWLNLSIWDDDICLLGVKSGLWDTGCTEGRVDSNSSPLSSKFWILSRNIEFWTNLETPRGRRQKEILHTWTQSARTGGAKVVDRIVQGVFQCFLYGSTNYFMKQISSLLLLPTPFPYTHSFKHAQAADIDFRV